MVKLRPPYPRHVTRHMAKVDKTEANPTKLSLKRLSPKKAIVRAPMWKAPSKRAPPKKATPKKAAPMGAQTTRNRGMKNTTPTWALPKRTFAFDSSSNDVSETKIGVLKSY